jgi:hypothetical protein
MQELDTAAGTGAGTELRWLDAAGCFVASERADQLGGSCRLGAARS